MENSLNNFIEKAKKVHSNKYDYSKITEYTYTKKVCIICPEHGEFWQTPKNHLTGRGCPICRYASVSKKLSLTTEIFIEKAKKLYGNIFDYSKVEYKNNYTKVCIICPEHGEFWTTPNNFLNGHTCPKCNIKERAKNAAMGTKSFVEKAKKIHGDKYDYSKVEYINSRTKVCIICPIHGEFWITPDSHLYQNGGCHKCNHSKLENLIFDFLTANNFEFETQKGFKWLRYKKPLRLDFYLPKYNIAIECQGVQHFEPIKYFGGNKTFNEQVKRDNTKRKLCNEHNIKIIYITKKDKQNIKNILYEQISD